ncbi:MAG: microcin C ABC transporter permease YejB, partial [Pseudomonadota bacterium]
VNFVIIQAVPGGPIEQMIARINDIGASATARLEGDTGDLGTEQAQRPSDGGLYRGSRGLPKEFIDELRVEYGFDKPAYERFLLMMGNYLRFDFGESYFRDISVVDLVVEKLPVSISLGLWTTLITYLVSIPLGIRKAAKDGSNFDIWTSGIIIFGNAVPGFLFAVLLIVVFAGGSYLDWFPLRGLVSDNWQTLSWPAKIVDYLWHMVLPITALVIGSFAVLTMLTKNSFVDQISQQYVLTARAKGLAERKVLYGHVFRNAMLIVIAGFPATFVSILFTGALLVEIIFSLDGLGLLGFEAAINRDYPVMFATLYVFTLIGLLLRIVADLTYVLVDPRIDFEARNSV